MADCQKKSHTTLERTLGLAQVESLAYKYECTVEESLYTIFFIGLEKVRLDGEMIAIDNKGIGGEEQKKLRCFTDYLQCIRRVLSKEEREDLFYEYLVLSKKNRIRAQCDIQILFDIQKEGIQIQYDNVDELAADSLTGIFSNIIHALQANGEVPVAEIKLLDEDTYQAVICDFATNDREYEENENYIDVFQKQVGKTPDNIAVRDRSRELTYVEFNAEVNRIANALMELGIQKGDVVGCLLPSDVSVAVAILGIMKTGAMYLPISNAMPKDRITYMMQDSKAKGILTNREYARVLDGEETVYYYEDLMKHSNIENPNVSISVCDSYACMYTSGSTGRPKGVLTVHYGLYEGKYKNVTGVQQYGNTIMSAPITFIMSVVELIIPIVEGNSVFICEPEEMKNPVAFRDLLCESDINLFICTPSYFDVLTKDPVETRRLFEHINVVFLAGEKVYINDTVKEALRESDVKIYDIYGSTEIHTCAYRPIHESSGEVPPFAKILLHNREGHILPPGLKGEIYVGSTCVGNGYMNNKEETDKRFLTNYCGRERTFRTGDIGVLDQRGYLRLVGRNDFQVKIRGYRVEVKEVEMVVGECAGVKKGIVVARTNKENEKYLCAFYEGDCEPSDVKTYLEQRLPNYMIPSFVIKMQALPMLVSGKYDIQKLTELDLEEFINDYEEPGNAIEEKLCAIWEEILDLKRVGIADNLFEIGGDSIKLARIMAQIKQQMGTEVNYVQFFNDPTVRGLAEQIQSTESQIEEWNKAECKEYYEMTPSQIGIYLNSRKDGNTNYNLPYCIRFDKSFQVDRFRHALEVVVNRHDIFRTTFHYMDGHFFQKIHKEPLFDFEYEEVEVYQETMFQQFVRPFGLDKLPLLRVKIIKDKTGYAVLLDIHHILVDGYSMNLMFTELGKIYEGKELAPCMYQYKDYSERLLDSQYVNLINASNQYWTSVLEQAETFTLDFCPDSSMDTSMAKENVAHVFRTVLSKDICNSVKVYCKDNQITEPIFYLGCACILFRNYCSQNEFVVGMPVIGRDSAEAMNIMGAFVHTLPMVMQVMDESTLNQFLHSVKANFVQALNHQFCQLEKITDSLSEGKKTAMDSIFNVMFVYQNNEKATWNSDGVKSVDTLDVRDSKYDLLLEVEEDDAIEFHMEYRTTLFEAKTIKRMMEHFMVIIKSVLKNDKVTVRDLSICTNLDNAEWRQNNDTLFAGRQNTSVVEWFQECVEKYADSIAVEAQDGVYTYQQLDSMSNQVANALLEQNVESGDIIPFIVSRNSHMVIAMLGILKAGCGYMPIDNAYPQNRIDYMVADCDAKVIVLDKMNRDKCGAMCDCIYIEDVLATGPQKAPEVVVTSEKLCYCIYTSGSTGKPKGTLVPHRTVSNLVDWQQRETSMHLSGRVLAGTTISFDVATQEIFSALLSGGTLVILADGVKTNIKEYCGWICDKQIDVIFCTPSFFDMLAVEEELVTRVCRQLSDIVFAGEALSIRKSLARCMKEQNVTIHNHYGPTESHVVTAKTYANGYDGDNHSIGKPIQNTSIYIIGENGQVMPAGVPGELCISGSGVGNGYYKREELTQQKFVFDEALGVKIYKTGDLARWNNSGELEFLGRMDDQIKLRGQRIELGEVRNAILRQPGVLDAVVIVSKEERGEFLCAYVVSKQELDFGEMKKMLRMDLAEYMVPELYMQINAIPLSNNGKVQKSALPPIGNVSVTEYVEPGTSMETYLCSVFEKVLGIERVGIHDNFFKIGGHSLKAMHLINEIENETGKRVELKELFQYPTVEELADILEGLQTTEQGIAKAEAKAFYSATPAQTRMYVLNQMNHDNCAYNIPIFFQVVGKLDVHRLNACLQKIVDTYSILRTNFTVHEGEVVQVINEDVSIWVEEQVPLERFVRPFDVEQDSLLRVCYNQEKHMLILDIHHIIADGITVRNLVNLIKSTYETGRVDDSVLQYCDYSEWLHNTRMCQLENQREYWLDKFDGDIPVLNLLTDYPRPMNQSFRGKTITVSIEKELSEAVRNLARRGGNTPYMVFLAALFITISKYARQQDIVMGTPVSGRTTRQMESMPGLFVNTVPLRLDVNPEWTVEEILTAVKNECACTFDNQEYPFEDMMRDLGLQREHSRNPLYDIVFNMHTDEYLSVDMGDAALKEIDMSQHYNIAKFDLNINIKENQEQYDVLWEYATDLFAVESIETMLSVYLQVLKQMVHHEQMRLKEMRCYDEEQKHFILEELNQVKWYELPYRNIGKAFEAVSEQCPDKIALVFKEQSYSYKELYDMALAMCCKLDALGVTQGERVAVCIERCEKMVVLQLAILMKGCIFVPIDNDYPDERIQYIINNSKAQLSIVDNHLQNKVNAKNKIVTWEELESVSAVDSGSFYITSDSLLEQECYNIYTSGSTGKPKGCRLTQKGILNFCLNNNILATTKKMKHPVGVAVNSVAFDFFIAETLFMFLNGYTVVLADRQEQTEQVRLKELVLRNHVNTIQTTPTRLGLYIENRKDVDYFRQFELIVLSGEELKKPFFKEIKKLCDAKIYNPCGPSEASVWAAGGDIADCECDTSKEIHIGKPICNTRLYVVDENLNLLPPGMPGELAIGGYGVGLGYIDKTLSKERFVENPYADGFLYRTGDLAAWNKDGNIRYLGRMDQQVKIKGIRIEIGEIESVIKRQNGIRQAVVLVKEIENEKQLWAYYTADTKINGKELRSGLMEVLPKYMVPLRMMQIDSMFYNANGKLDKSQFPEIPLEVIEEHVTDLSQKEKELLDVMKTVLGVTQIGLDSDFFELGGDSIKAIRMVTKFRELGYEIAVKDIMSSHSVKAMLDEAAATTMNDCPQEEYVGYVEKAPVIEEFLEWDLENPDYFNQCYFIKLKSSCYQLQHLREVLNQMSKMHDMLRATLKNGDLSVGPWAAHQYYGLKEFDMRSVEEKHAFVERIGTELNASMCLETGPLLQVGVFQDDEETHILFSIHHLVIDGVSWRIFMDDFCDLYEKAMRGQELVMREKTASYNAWVEALKEYGKTYPVQSEFPYWRNIVENIQLIQQPCKQASNSTLIKTMSFSLSEDDTENLLMHSHEAYNTETQELLVAALVRAIGNVDAQSDVSISLEGHGREELHVPIKTDRTIGWFTNLYPQNFHVEEEQPKQILHVKETIRRIPNKGMGYGAFKEAEKQKAPVTKPSVCFNYLGDFDAEQMRGGLFEASEYSCGTMMSPNNRLSNDISINSMVVNQQLQMNISYDASVFSEEWIKELLGEYKATLQRFIQHCTTEAMPTYSASDFGDTDLSEDDLSEILDLFD